MSSGLGTTNGSKGWCFLLASRVLILICFADEEKTGNINSSVDDGSTPKKGRKDKQFSEDKEDCKQPWLALASYVDELTVGGRRNSKGQYIDGMGSFPGFGKNKQPKVPPDCFPPRCYEK